MVIILTFFISLAFLFVSIGIVYLIWQISKEFQNLNQIISNFNLEETRKINGDELNNPDAENMFVNSKVNFEIILMES